MKNNLSVFLLFAFFGSLSSQNLVSFTLLGTKTQVQLVDQFEVPFILYGAKYYRVLYTTNDLQGQPDTVSGLLVAPDNPTKIYPRLVYQHGTSGSTQDVPSVNILTGGEGDIGLLFAGLGYLTLMPDYLGLGVSDDVFHPYVHAETEASVALDMLRAAAQFAAQNNIETNDQLFITGYSQGGHAAMALHREIQTNLSGEFTVTAAAPMSGPYSIGGVMRTLILSNQVYYYPAYVPNTAISYQTVYGNIFNQLTDIFKPLYAAPIQQFYDGAIDLSELNDQLISLLVANEGACIPTKMLQPAVVTAVLTDNNHPINVALRANDVYRWAPSAPTRLIYCTADDQVPAANAFVARDTMLALGAPNVAMINADPAANHSACVVPALTNALLFFLNLQQVGTVGASEAAAAAPLVVAPNPAGDFFTFENDTANAALRVTAADGRPVRAELLPAGTRRIDTRDWPDGVYWIQLHTAAGVRTAKLLVQH